MKWLKYHALLIAFPLVILSANGYAAGSGGNYESERQKVEKGTPPFNPAYFKESSRRHIAAYFDVSDGVLKLSGKPFEVRTGKMPYRPKGGGSIQIVFKGPDGKIIGQYAVDDPVLLRSCDAVKEETGNIKVLKTGTVEVLLLYDSRINTLEIGPNLKELKKFEIAPQIKKAINR